MVTLAVGWPLTYLQVNVLVPLGDAVPASWKTLNRASPIIQWKPFFENWAIGTVLVVLSVFVSSRLGRPRKSRPSYST